MKKIIILLFIAISGQMLLNAQTAMDFYSKGVKKADKGDFIGAKDDFEIALQIDPDYANAHNNLALILMHNFKDKEGAKMHYEKAIALAPNDPVAHFNYAVLLKDNYSD